jgi:hypothetical protein
VNFCFSVVVEKVAEREARCYIRNYIAGSSINVSADIYGYRPIGEKNQQAEPTLSLKELQARQAKGQLGAARRSLEDELLMLHIDTELPPDQIEAKRDMEKKLLYTGQALDKYGLCDGLDPQHRKTIEEMLACKYLLMFVGEAELDTILAGFAEKRLPISGLERFVQESILDLYLQDPMREFFTVKTKDELEGFKVDTIILHMLAIFQFDKIKSINNKELVIKRKKLLCDGVLLHIHSRKAKIGSDIRSDIAYRRVVRNILKDRDVEIYQPALEVIIELLATKESLSGYIYDTYMPLLQISEEERGFAEALINLAIKAKSNNVHFFTLSRSDGQRFYETLKNVIKRVANESMLLWRELKDYALEITKAHPNVSKEILAILHECGFGQKELARTQLIAPLNIEKQLNSAA